MRAILIDPMFKKLQEVEYSGNYKDIYKLIGYDDIIMNDRVLMKGYRPTAFDVVRIPIGFDGIYVDDEGLYAPLRLDGLSNMEQYMNLYGFAIKL